MSYLISKLVLNKYRYYASFHLFKSSGWSVQWEGLRDNADNFPDKSIAEDHLDMVHSEMKESDNSKLEIIKI